MQISDAAMTRLSTCVSQSHYPLLFATVSGAHLYGFASPDSDYDLRGVHILPVRNVVGLEPGEETVEFTKVEDGYELDLVTHDVKKFFGLLLKKNGYVLEQLYSPLVVHARPEFHELRRIAKSCITRHHAHHYFGFFETQWKLFEKEKPRRVKPLLYVYRVLLTGIHLMRTGTVEANLSKLNEIFRLPFLPELIGRKISATEKCSLEAEDFHFHSNEAKKLLGELEAAARESTLPEAPSGRSALNDLLIRLRLS